MSTRISRYEIRDVLGRGEIGIVYQAHDPQAGHDVALKVLCGDSPLPDSDRRRYFEQEAHILQRLDHRHIPRFFEYGTGNKPYLAFELISGKDLEVVLGEWEGFLPQQDVIKWAVQLCDVLAYLHNLNPNPIAFRDLKPSHVVVDEQKKAWLVDFNVAVVLPPDRVLAGADLIGTPGFAAPEQYTGIIWPQVDIYALGASLHYLLTRRDPRKEEPFTFHSAPPRSLNSAISEQMEAVILKAVEFEVHDRYQNAEEMKAALLECL